MLNRKILIISFISYIVIIIWLVYFKANISEWVINTKNFFLGMSLFSKIRYGIIPFEHFRLWKVKSYLLNVLIFIPFFIYLKLLKPNISKNMLLFLLIIIPILIEVFQLFIPFCGFAVEDIICNMMGLFFGLIIIQVIKKHNYLLVNRLAIASLVVLVPIAVYAIINTIINFKIYQ